MIALHIVGLGDNLIRVKRVNIIADHLHQIHEEILTGKEELMPILKQIMVCVVSAGFRRCVI